MNHGIVKDFRFNPERHRLLFSGDEIRTGMRILLEDEMMRGSIFRKDEPSARDLEVGRWCTVGKVERTGYPQHDENGYTVEYINYLVSFEAIYDDGHVCKRTYNRSFAWYEEIPEPPLGEYAQIVRDGMLAAFPDLVMS